MDRTYVNYVIDRVVATGVSRNRLKSILGQCKTVEEFLDLTPGQMMEKYRLTKLGKNSTVDLSGKTYKAMDDVRREIKQQSYDERKSERDAQRAEMWFTKDDITLTAAFMDTYKIAKIEMRQIRQLLNVLKREEAQKAPVPCT